MKDIIKYIGKVHSELKRMEDCPLQENENAPGVIIEIFEEYMTGIKDIKPGDQVILFTWLDRSDRAVLETKPRNDPNAPLTGVFSTRSPDRPNPVGIHLVNVVSLLPPNKIQVSRLEVLDQTPLIDIKPDLRS